MFVKILYYWLVSALRHWINSNKCIDSFVTPIQIKCYSITLNTSKIII